MEVKFVYMTGSYSHRFTCKANGYKILFFRGRSHLVKDEESIEQLREDPFYTEVGVDAPVEKASSSLPRDSVPSKKPSRRKRTPKLSKAVESKRA